VRTSLTRNERIFAGSTDPRGIVAASTAASLSAPLVAQGIGGANKLPATFLVIIGTSGRSGRHFPAGHARKGSARAGIVLDSAHATI
jgi:hypothetical protein